MWTILIPYVLCGIMGVLSGFLRGLGFSLQPMIATVSCVLIVRTTWIFVFFPMNHTIEWLYLCYPITYIATCLVEAVMIFLAARKVKEIIAKSEESEREKTLTEGNL